MLGIYDIIAVNLAYGVALWLRFDLKFSLIPRNYLMGWFKFIPIFAVLVVIVFIALRLYKSIWEYVSYSEMIRCFWACIILGVLEVMGTLLFTCRMPISFYLMGWILMFVVTAGIRLSYRATRIGNRYFNLKDNSLEKVLIVGMSNIIRVT